MPYCPECGKKVSITDKRCSKCGTKLSKDLFEDIPKPNEFVSQLNDNTQKIKNRKYHNIEFALALITIILTALSISITSETYYMSENVLLLFIIFIFVGIIAAIITRYYAKTGAIILLLVGVMFTLSGFIGIIPIIFYIITVVAAFYLN